MARTKANTQNNTNTRFKTLRRNWHSEICVSNRSYHKRRHTEGERVDDLGRDHGLHGEGGGWGKGGVILRVRDGRVRAREVGLPHWELGRPSETTGEMMCLRFGMRDLSQCSETHLQQNFISPMHVHCIYFKWFLFFMLCCLDLHKFIRYAINSKLHTKLCQYIKWCFVFGLRKKKYWSLAFIKAAIKSVH